MSKYYLSLCCIIKDERYLEEFIVYYNVLGVEHFIYMIMSVLIPFLID